MACAPVNLSPRLSAAEGRAKLEEHLRSFVETPRDMVVRVTAGTGKTTLAAQVFAEQLGNEIVHWFVPTLKLGRDTLGMLRTNRPSLEVMHIEGRSAENCQRYEFVQSAGKVRLPIERTCSDSRSSETEDLDNPIAALSTYVCPFKRDGSCKYFAQFEKTAQVYISAHNHIVLPKRKTILAADLNVIDEAFYRHLIRDKTIPKEMLDTCRQLDDFHELLRGSEISLERFRERGIDA